MTATDLFKASEMLDMAVRIEHQGLKFYEACLASQTDPGVREVFRFLMDQEKEHARVFSQMKTDLLDNYTLPVDTIDFGLETEKGAILFYSGMQQCARASGVPDVDRIMP